MLQLLEKTRKFSVITHIDKHMTFVQIWITLTAGVDLTNHE